MPRLCSCAMPRFDDETNVCVRCGGIDPRIEGLDGIEDEEDVGLLDEDLTMPDEDYRE